jgi:ZIP family zinc transporter
MENLSPLVQALIAGLFTWVMTALGAALVFLGQAPSRRLLDAMLGFAAGVMIAASVWSLLIPALELSKGMAVPAWLPAAAGFAAGGLFLALLDRIIPHLHLGLPRTQAEGPKTSWHRSILLLSSITLHNIPEGLAIGVAFGAAAVGLPGTTLGAALALALGIGIQNFPEGTAVSLPLRREGLSRARSFHYAHLSAIVEPIAAVLGATAVLAVRSLLPYALSFAAGAMIFVVVEELIPESHQGGHVDLATGGALVGFLVMMVLDVSLG